MKLNKYDNKCVKITDIFGYEYEGNAIYNDEEYNECEFGKKMECLQILNFLFYKDIIKDIEVLENGFISRYGELEKEIVNDGIDDIIDAFEYEDDEHTLRIIRYIKDNEKIPNKAEMFNKVKEYLRKYNKNEEILKELLDMEEIINIIITNNSTLFGRNPKVNKINIGFTNTIYDIDDKYIVKICTDVNNEPKFIKEINFYNANKDNTLIPKLYHYSTDKKDVPYYYEILEKIKGVSVYDIWHTLNESQREEIIKQLCDAMKKFHSNKGEGYDWINKTKKLFNELYSKTKEMNLFNENEKSLLDKAYSMIDEYLKSDEFVLVHNDLHFDNIIYNEGQIKLIDFERSLYAPRDFELDIIYRMIRKPWKFASEEIEKYTKKSDYENIMKYIEKYYPELINIDNLYKRLAIYDIVYYLKHLINNPTLDELKEDILSAAEIVIK